jgi:hypothetical protein
VSDTLKPPAAIRIARPYANEDEFLAQELDMLTRTTVTLVGAQLRPQGVVLRFEVVLTSGQVILRGEGRVLAFKPNAHRGVAGLTLRFTRLDTRSKALVDRAASLRDQRRPSQAPMPSGASMPDVPASAPALELSLRDPPSAPAPEVTFTREDPSASQPDLALGDNPPSAPPPPVAVVAAVHPPVIDAVESAVLPAVESAVVPAEESAPQPALADLAAEPASAVRLSSARVVTPTPDRDALLTRLRARAKALAPSDVQRILAQKRQAEG